MHKSKKKSSKQLPKPIKVKKEKTEEDKSLHPMSHYVDDRLELVKQIFGTLKPKTITNLAPEFLKKKNMVEIEEFCLNELLCISTKRLLSIINATKCPSDTESSDDSDIQHQEEHISLEEISSDSEIEESASGTKKLNGDTGKRKTKKDTKKMTENIVENEGQISVLELLELQARARAIRSQLALEPVTKIEVDSADEQPEGQLEQKVIKEKNGKQKSCKRKSSESDRLEKSKSAYIPDKTKNDNINKQSNASTTEMPIQDKETVSQGGKKIKLKRNYRNSNQQRASTESNTNEVNKPNTNEVKKEQKLRSASPDVIPIVNEPETLLISDSEAEETSKITEGIENDKTNVNKVRKLSEEEEEAEEGEITESESEKIEKQNIDEIKVENEPIETNVSAEPETANQKQLEIVVTNTEGCVNTSIENNVNKNENEAEADAEIIKPSVEKNMEQIINDNTNEYQDDDDQNDDVISIGGDLESEMIEHLEEGDNDTNSKSSFVKDDAKSQNEDIISLGSSGEEDMKKKNESWHARYIKSSKVSKVLAASRLGKRVRDNIKKTKRSKKEDDTQAIEAQKPKETFTSQHEDGSIEQYKELLRLRKN